MPTVVFNKNYFWFYFIRFLVTVYTTAGTCQFKLGYFDLKTISLGFVLQSFTISYRLFPTLAILN